MTSGQWRVLIILSIVLGVDIIGNPEAQRFWKAMVTLDWGTVGADSVKGFRWLYFGYAIGMLALIGLAAVDAEIATWIAVLFLVTVLITHGDVIGPALQTGTNILSGLAGGNPQARTHGK